MFYSQFILAKKGPLGTIWIAAHLERKLRKNQVADTDIGVSVDSILSPDVPIALRLSSHLLLGVVRIYSRKVNYLFDDCSEALLKIKQAFRSTAVDLPPEQSKAPYHSITLPETFDLDDFELPDNDIYQGNYVDHHVSSREQITLQDTMDGMAYSATRFGLDERFGDGDTSGLDLDEELFVDKVGAYGDAGVSADPQVAVQTMTALLDHEGMMTNLTPVINGLGEDVNHMDDAQAPRTPGLLEEPNISNAQETSACDDHFESEDHQLTELAVKQKLENISGETDSQYGEKHADDWSLLNDTNSHSVVHMPTENGHCSVDLDIKPQEISSATEVTVEHIPPDLAFTSGPSTLLDNRVRETSQVADLPDMIVETSDFQYQKKNNEGVVSHGRTFHVSLEDDWGPDGRNLKTGDHVISGAAETCQQVPEGVSGNNHISSVIEVSDNQESSGVQEKSHSPGYALDVDVDIQGQIYQEPKESKTSSFDTNEKITGAEFPALRPCNANLDQPDSFNIECDQSVDHNLSNENAIQCSEETSGQGEILNASEKITGENLMRGSMSGEGIHVAVGKANDEVDNRIVRDSSVENINSSVGPDLPAPEKLLSVTEVPDDLPRNFMMDSTPSGLVRNDGDAGSSIISGRKRSYTESTLTEQSLNSIDSSRLVRSKRTVESIPDDDDLLSSILAGRKSSVLKVKPTPPAWEITSLKRRTPATRTSANKRKVLMDDTMVLHGDIIRQQLLNTEDIRRVRKKAPCTCSEISKIQKQFFEDEIFMDPIYTCASIELTSLHNQAYDLDGITISLDNVNCDTSTGLKLSTKDGDNNEDLDTENATDSTALNFAKESEKEGTIEPLIVTEDGKRETVEVPSIDESKLDEDHGVSLEVNNMSSEMKCTTDIETISSLLEHPEDVTEMDIDRRTLIADEVNAELPGADESSLPSDQVLGERGDISTDVAHVAEIYSNSTVMVQRVDKIETCKANASLSDGAPYTSHDEKIIGASQQMGAATGGEVVEGDCATGEYCDTAAAVEAECQTGYEVLPVASQGHDTVETAADGKSRETEYNSHSLVDKDFEQSMVDSSFAGDVDRHVENVLLDDGDHPVEEVVNPLLAKDDAAISFVYDHDALNYSFVGNETEFLNVDDDDVAEPTDDNLDKEEARFMENSGWSSRTRAVANYLQNLFVKQAGNTKPTLSMDNLLVGKTRKEASRMFFEALVLKTKDYIHVEQVDPYETITMKPHAKLLKSDF